jgi:hypothetical protein
VPTAVEPAITAGTGPERLISGTGPDRLVSASVAAVNTPDDVNDPEDLADGLGGLDDLGNLLENARAGRTTAAVTAAVPPSFYVPLYGGLHIPVPVTVDRHRVRVKS